MQGRRRQNVLFLIFGSSVLCCRAWTSCRGSHPSFWSDFQHCHHPGCVQQSAVSNRLHFCFKLHAANFPYLRDVWTTEGVSGSMLTIGCPPWRCAGNAVGLLWFISRHLSVWLFLSERSAVVVQQLHTDTTCPVEMKR